MEAINQRINWYRTKISSPLLAKLSKPDDRNGWLQAGGHVGLALLTGSMTIYFGFHYPWAVLPALLVHGAIINCMVAAEHELVHERVFKTSFLNRIFANIVSFLTFENHRLFWLSHNEHHKFTLHPPDDLEQVLPQKINAFQLLVYTFFDYTSLKRRLLDNFYLALGKPHGEWQAYLFNRSDQRTINQVCNFSRFLLLAHGSILVVSMIQGWWVVPLAVSFAWLFGSILFYLMGLPQHMGLMDEINDFRLSCRTFYQNWFFEFLYWHMNYHTEHHMYPAVPCYNLPRLHQAIKHEMPYCPNGLFETWVQLADILIKQKYDPSYEYRAVLPEERRQQSGNSPATSTTADVIRVVARVWECQLCGFIYDEAEGLPEDNIAPGTRWEDIPDDWICPVCGVAKAMFKMVEITREVAATRQRFPMDAIADPVVIVGSGIAGYSVAREIRKDNPNLPLLIITRDGGENYYKPNLSVALSQAKSPIELVLATAPEMADRLHAEIWTETTVTRIRPTEKQLTTSRGELKYHKLVLATGAEPIKLPLNGNRTDAVLHINNLADYRRFRETLAPGASVLIIGAGLIGCEFANDLALQRHPVTVVDVATEPLSRFIPSEIGAMLRQQLAQTGVRWMLESSVVSIDDADGQLCCTTSGGTILKVDLVLSAVGLCPQIALAREAGLITNHGILVDAHLRTSDPNIYAIGDCMELAGTVRPFVLPIQNSLRVLAQNLTGADSEVDFPVMPIEVKTTTCPMLIVPPAAGQHGTWSIEGAPPDILARYMNDAGQLLGFVLTGRNLDQSERLITLMRSASSEPHVRDEATMALMDA